MMWAYIHLAVSAAMSLWAAGRMLHRFGAKEFDTETLTLVAGIFIVWPLVLFVEGYGAIQDRRWQREVRRVNAVKGAEAIEGEVRRG